MTSTRIAACNRHDDGYDLVPGGSVRNRPVARVWWQHDDTGGDDSGLVLRADTDALLIEDLPVDGAQVARTLARHGYELDADSIDAIDRLVHEALARPLEE